MSNWRIWITYKDEGPWDFTEQPDKWGYLNNKRWSLQQDAQEFCEDIGLSLDPTHTHRPCGHWHKGDLSSPTTYEEIWAPNSCFISIGLYSDGTEVFVFFPVWMSTVCAACGSPIGTQNGLLSLIYDSQGRVFIEGQGMIDAFDEAVWSVANWDTEIITPQYLGAEVVDDTYFAVAATNWVGYGTNYIWIFRDGIMSRKSFLAGDATHSYYNGNMGFAMDASGNIAVPVEASDDTAETRGIKVAVSHNYGESFSEIEVVAYDVSSDSIFVYEPNILIDSNGTFWLLHGYRKTNTPTSYKLRLFKSTNQGDSWSYVNEISVDSSSGRRVRFFIDGTDLYIGKLSASGILYKSIDAGVTFNSITTFTNETLLAVGVNSGVICVAVFLSNGTDAEIRRSTNGGSSYDVVKTMHESDDYTGELGFASARFRIMNDVWVFMSWTLQKTDDDSRPFLISYNNGVTWNEVSGISRTEESYVYEYNNIGTTLNEPQVWTMNF